MAERPRELDQRFQMGGQFEAIEDLYSPEQSIPVA